MTADFSLKGTMVRGGFSSSDGGSADFIRLGEGSDISTSSEDFRLSGRSGQCLWNDRGRRIGGLTLFLDEGDHSGDGVVFVL